MFDSPLGADVRISVVECVPLAADSAGGSSDLMSAPGGGSRRFGGLDCGCVRNPVTRRMVLFDFYCRRHLGDLSLNNNREETR